MDKSSRIIRYNFYTGWFGRQVLLVLERVWVPDTDYGAEGEGEWVTHQRRATREEAMELVTAYRPVSNNQGD